MAKTKILGMDDNTVLLLGAGAAALYLLNSSGILSLTNRISRAGVGIIDAAGNVFDAAGNLVYAAGQELYGWTQGGGAPGVPLADPYLHAPLTPIPQPWSVWDQFETPAAPDYNPWPTPAMNAPWGGDPWGGPIVVQQR